MNFFLGLFPILSHYGIGLGGVGAGVLFAVFSPVGKKIGWIFAILASVVTVAYGIGVADGEHRVRLQWLAAEASITNDLAAARAKAEAAIPPLRPAAPVPLPKPGGLRHAKPTLKLDQYDRG